MSSNNPDLGTLSILPRELRDEIYRHLLNGHYYTYNTSFPLTTRSPNPDLSLFLVSKAAYDEGSSIFYSESVFQLGFDNLRNYYDQFRETGQAKPPSDRIVRRMRKIEVAFNCWNWGPKYCAYQIIKLNVARYPRDSLTVITKVGGLEFGETLLGHVSEELDAFRSFRTVTLKVKVETPPRSEAAEEHYVTRVIK